MSTFFFNFPLEKCFIVVNKTLDDTYNVVIAFCFSAEEVAGKVTLKHIYEIALMKKQDPVNRHVDLKEMCEMVIQTAHTCGIQVVRHLDPVEYGQFLEERNKVVEEQEQELQEAKQAKLLRLS